MSDDIQEFIETVGTARIRDLKQRGAEAAAVPQTTSRANPGDTSQWSILGDDRFRPTGATCFSLPPGLYKISTDDWGIYFTMAHPATDSLVRLPDSAGEKVIAGIDSFWQSKSKFQARGHVFKRGILLWGPPGGGKTATVNQISADLIEHGGMVLWIQNPDFASVALMSLRRIEPERPIICILEDLDELASRHSEHEILSLLDGENQVDNVVFVATTNYPELLDPRMINRPSRFDEVIKIGMPTAEARTVYIRSRLPEQELDSDALGEWVKDTDNFSIAHIKELIIAVYCLGRGYPETLARLRAMMRGKPTSDRSGRIAGMAPRDYDEPKKANGGTTAW